MFTKPCPEEAVHEPHEHVHHWPKQEAEPEGWFPPGTYMENTLEEGMDAVYRCRGVIPVEDSQDIVDGVPRYELCERCNYHQHICGGCGTHLTHSGHELKDGQYILHGTRCVD